MRPLASETETLASVIYSGCDPERAVGIDQMKEGVEEVGGSEDG